MDDVTEDNERAYRGLEDLAKLAEGAASVAPAEGDIRPYYVGWGLLAAVHRQAAAVVLLHRHGLGHEGAPNRRTLIEHLAQIRWLAEDGADAVDSMNLALKYKQQKLREAADAASMSYDATIADIVQATEIPANPSNRFNTLTPLLKRLGAPMHAAWIGETQLAHPTLTAAEAFFDNSDEDTVKLLDEPLYRQDGPSPAERAPYIAMVLVWCAMESFARLLPGDPWGAELQRIASEAGIDNSSTDQVA